MLIWNPGTELDGGRMIFEGRLHTANALLFAVFRAIFEVFLFRIVTIGNVP